MVKKTLILSLQQALAKKLLKIYKFLVLSKI